MKVLQLLYHYQEKEYKLKKVKEDSRVQDIERELLELQKTFSAMENEFEKLRNQKKELLKNIKEGNDREELLKMKEDEYRSRLYKGKGGSKELEQLQKKIENLHSERDELEEETLQLMYNMDSLSSQESDLKEKMLDYEEKIKKVQSTLEQYLLEQKGKEEGLKKELKKLEELIDPAWLKKYEELKSHYQKPISPIKNGVCSGCRVMLTPFVQDKVKRGLEQICCENCGRLLVWVD